MLSLLMVGIFVVLLALTALGVLVLTRTTVRDLGRAMAGGLGLAWRRFSGMFRRRR